MEELMRVLGDKESRASLLSLTGDRAQLLVNYMHSASAQLTTLLSTVIDFIRSSNS